jgi:hypothetical protein
MDSCAICTIRTSAIHWHHTIPQSLGGINSLQIPLCGNCHTTLHSKADALVAFKRGGKPPKQRYWDKIEHEHSADFWLNVLVQSMLNPPKMQGEKLTLLPSIKVNDGRRKQLGLLKDSLKHQGITNMSQVLEYCVKFTLIQKGLCNEEVETRASNPSKRNKLGNQQKNNYKRAPKVRRLQRSKS